MAWMLGRQVRAVRELEGDLSQWVVGSDGEDYGRMRFQESEHVHLRRLAFNRSLAPDGNTGSVRRRLQG